jgi:hypothetical protein
VGGWPAVALREADSQKRRVTLRTSLPPARRIQRAVLGFRRRFASIGEPKPTGAVRRRRTTMISASPRRHFAAARVPAAATSTGQVDGVFVGG